MPFYEYRCAACGHEFEELQKVSDPVLKRCPECNKNRLEKLVSAAAFKLTGTGWYETDFKDKKKAKDDGSEKSDSKSGEAKSGENTSSDDKSGDSKSKDAGSSKAEKKSTAPKTDAGSKKSTGKKKD